MALVKLPIMWCLVWGPYNPAVPKQPFQYMRCNIPEASVCFRMALLTMRKVRSVQFMHCRAQREGE